MPTADELTLKLAKEAMAVPNACNLCGVAQRLARAMLALHGLDKSACSTGRHPVTLLWVDKLQHLAGLPQQYKLNDDSPPDAANAYRACDELGNGRDVEWNFVSLF
jgi:hypothetical protein